METVFRAEPLDGPTSARLLDAFAEEIASRYPGWNPSIGPSALPEEFIHPRGRFLVGYRGEHAVACGGVKRLDDTTGEIKRLFVVPEARGLRISRELLGSLEDAARELGWHAVRLDTGNKQPESLALFRASGYREIADYNANPFASYWFEKSLA
jgi:GNAT superfamily N-acetyltransferase